MELYHAKEYRDNYLKISVEVPSDDPNIDGEVFAVHNFSTHFSPDPEIM